MKKHQDIEAFCIGILITCIVVNDLLFRAIKKCVLVLCANKEQNNLDLKEILHPHINPQKNSPAKDNSEICE